MSPDVDVDVAIIGAGTAGLHALSEVRRETDRFVVIDGGPLGTMCARVGCMPSKALIQVAEDFDRRRALHDEGIAGAEHLTLDAERAFGHVRALRDRFVAGVMENAMEPLGDRLVRGYARFLEPDLLEVGERRIRARAVVVATGSRPTVPKAWRRFGERVLTTDTLFEQTELPETLAVLGLGPLGLEMGQALSRWGAEVTGFDALGHIGGLADPHVNRIAIEALGREFPIHLGATADVEEEGGRLRVTAAETSVRVERLLVAVGRTPNLERLDLGNAGIEVDDRGMPSFDRETMQVADLPIFLAGDVDGDRAILHEAGHEGRVAGYNAAHDRAVRFRRLVPLNIAFTDPNIASVGAPWTEPPGEDVAVGQADFRGGRALVMGQETGLIRVYADRRTGLLTGAAMVAPHGEHLAHLLAWALHARMGVGDLLEMPVYHPVVEETLRSALTDLAGELDVRSPFPLGITAA